MKRLHFLLTVYGIFSLMLLILIPYYAPILAVLMYFRLRSKIKSVKVQWILEGYVLLICSYLAIASIATNFLLGEYFYVQSTTAYVYGLFVITSLIFLLFMRYGVNAGMLVEKKASNHPCNVTIWFFFIPALIMSFKIIMVGLNSGYSMSTPGWREAVGQSLSGSDWLIFKSWVIVAIFAALIRAKNKKLSLFLILISSASLSLYGGRFLVFACLSIYTLSFLNESSLSTIKVGWKKVLLIASFFLVIVIAGMLRYINAEGLDFSLNLFFQGLMRQLSGPVYDFSLSNLYVNSDIAQELIIEKFRESLLPFVFDYKLGDTLGHYLAVSAGRGFEFGHRIAVAGEAYYLGGYSVVIISALIFSYLIVVAQKLYQGNILSKLIGGMVLFNIIFSVHIDLAHIVTLVYMLIYTVGMYYASMLFVGRSLRTNLS